MNCDTYSLGFPFLSLEDFKMLLLAVPNPLFYDATLISQLFVAITK